MLQNIRDNLIAKYRQSARQKIVVAMSGGVDSSTVAALLHEAGHEVIGITLQLYSTDYDVKNLGTCCAGKDIYDAQMAAAKIGIPHYVFNYEHNFKAEVMDKFADSYMNGETPIPCVLCNQKIKFRDLLRAAEDLSAHRMATGHYVQRIDIDSEPQLHKGADPMKDQSYFLFTTTHKQLSMLEFPLGGLTKDKTRDLAQYYGLDIADKPDSQDICFVPKGNYRDIVMQLRPEAERRGQFIMTNGKILGQHNGIINYTIGQRKGLGISYSEPLYVVKINPKENEVILGTKDELLSKNFKIRDINWLLQDIPSEIECSVKLRSAHVGGIANIVVNGDGTADAELYGGYPGITPGQACVMYDGTRVLGGGWIMRVE
jgi:tRNA-specific 2-thiouridylase